MSRPVVVVTPLDREFLGVRCRLIELAASFDRIDRAGGASDDPRIAPILESLKVLADGDANRAAKVQMAFSIKDL
jgi:hypothetical protein